MNFRFYIFLILFSSTATSADKSSFLDPQNGEMLKYRDDQVIVDIGIQASHTDNHLYQNQKDKQGTSYLQISPSVKAQYHNDQQFLQFGLWLKARKYKDFSQDNSTDSYGLVKYHHKFLHNQSVVVSAALFDNYEERGTGISKGKGDELLARDNRKSNFVNIAYQLGNEDSNAKLISLLGRRETNYQNRRKVTASSNLSAIYSIFDFNYLVSGNSYFTAKLSLEDVRHEITTQQDRLISSALLGLKWHKTEFTYFDLALGLLNINFANGALDNKQDYKWDFKFNWSPLETIELSAITLRSVAENRQVENSYLISDQLGLNISYQLNDKIALSLQNSIRKLDYYFEDGNKTENSLNSNLTLDYQFQTNMLLSLSYRYQSLEAITLFSDYQRNTISMEVVFVL